MRPLTAIYLAAALAFLAACSGQAERSDVISKDFTVDTLFTKDGCTVYRFRDAGHPMYFTNCSGSTQWKQGCGKNCTRRAGVEGGAT